MPRRSLTSLSMLVAFRWKLLEATAYMLLKDHWVSTCSLCLYEVGTDVSCQAQEMNFTSATVCPEHWQNFPWGKRVSDKLLLILNLEISNNHKSVFGSLCTQV